MSQRDGWRHRMAELLPLYGHRNWIIIADAAFPAQVGAAEVIATGDAHLDLVREVMRALVGAPHVRPVVWLDAELDALTDELAPGSEATRAFLLALLGDTPPERIRHSELLDRLQAVAAQYRILVLKSTGTIPYSSVFVELDCGYWGGDAEAALRRRMDRSGVAGD